MECKDILNRIAIISFDWTVGTDRSEKRKDKM